MVWGTDSCDNITYADITSGVWPGCATASDGHVTCDLEPRPGCCYDRLHHAAGIFGAIYCAYGLLLICFICSRCNAACEASEARTAAAAAASAATAAASAAAARTLDDAAAAARAK